MDVNNMTKAGLISLARATASSSSIFDLSYYQRISKLPIFSFSC